MKFLLVLIALLPFHRGDWQHWIDADHDCQDTRQEILIRDSITPVEFGDAQHCRVKSGTWRDAYTLETITDPKTVDIDHMVPLQAAHRAGAAGWSPEQKRDYANDPFVLVITLAKWNRQKGARGPEEWRPPLKTRWCSYALKWEAVKFKYGLTFTSEEGAALLEMLRTCGGTDVGN